MFDDNHIYKDIIDVRNPVDFKPINYNEVENYVIMADTLRCIAEPD